MTNENPHRGEDAAGAVPTVQWAADETACQFLRLILPDRGYYVALIIPTAGRKLQPFASTIEDLWRINREADQAGHTAYHACASFREARHDPRGTPHAHRQYGRTSHNALGAKAFWLDLDVGADKPYASWKSAAEAVSVFCGTVGIPSPLFVSSGLGLHVYWPLTATLEPATWLQYARGLKALCTRHGLQADPARTADIASVLRTPGTHNRKDGIREVRCGPWVPPSPIEQFKCFLDALEDPLSAHGASVPIVRERLPPHLAKRSLRRVAEAAIALSRQHAPSSGAQIAEHCEQVRALRDTRGNIPEPLWYAALGVLAFAKDGAPLAHEWSSGDARYTRGETQERLDRASALSGPTTCGRFHELNPLACERCPSWQKITSPIALGEAAPEQAGARRAVFLDAREPLNVARAFIEARYTTGEAHTLHHFQGVFYRWKGAYYSPLDTDAIRAEMYDFIDPEGRHDQSYAAHSFDPTRARVSDAIDALKAAAHLRNEASPPFWIGSAPAWDACDIVSCKNGLLHLPTRRLMEHSPSYFSLSSLPFAYAPDLPLPVAWMTFLQSIWPSDTDSIGALQEIFGYCLASDTRQQKMFLLIGPKRSGKSTIGRVLADLLGQDNVAGPTLALLGTPFGLATLMGKRLAIISDARLSGKADQQIIVERLLSISGEDALTIDRKHLAAWTGRLPTRFLILTNELPRLADASGALAGRMIVLRITESFFGREDYGLQERLRGELPGVLNWALDGLDRLRQRGRFASPASSAEVVQELEDLGSPIGAFLKDRCVVGVGQRVEVSKLFAAWQRWCAVQGRSHPGTAQSFGRDLRAALPQLRTGQVREDGQRPRCYEGVGLKP